jgi:hypothetical protein
MATVRGPWSDPWSALSLAPAPDGGRVVDEGVTVFPAAATSRSAPEARTTGGPPGVNEAAELDVPFAHQALRT